MILFVFFGSNKGGAGNWSMITGECRMDREMNIKKGTKVRMYTMKNGKVILEETILEKERRGLILDCEKGTYVLLDGCGNLVLISEKPQIKERVIHEPVPVKEIIIREPVYITPPPVAYLPPAPPPPIYLQPPAYYFPPIFLNIHVERHRIKIHSPYPAPRPPVVNTLPPVW